MRKLFFEYIGFLIHARKWWMIPLIVILFVILTIFYVAQTYSTLPFIYALF